MQIVGRTWLNLVTWTVGHEVKVSMTYTFQSLYYTTRYNTVLVIM